MVVLYILPKHFIFYSYCFMKKTHRKRQFLPCSIGETFYTYGVGQWYFLSPLLTYLIVRMESDECGYSVSVQILQVASLFYRPNNSTKLLFFTITHKLFFILFIPKSALYRSRVDGMECCGSYTTWNGCEIGRCHITSTTIKYTDEYSFCCFFVYAFNPENPLVVVVVCGWWCNNMQLKVNSF